MERLNIFLGLLLEPVGLIAEHNPVSSYCFILTKKKSSEIKCFILHMLFRIVGTEQISDHYISETRCAWCVYMHTQHS